MVGVKTVFKGKLYPLTIGIHIELQVSHVHSFLRRVPNGKVCPHLVGI